MADNNTHHLLQNCIKTAHYLNSLLKNLSEEVVNYRPFDDAWTIREHIIHLSDTDLFAYVKCARAFCPSPSDSDFEKELLLSRKLSYNIHNLTKPLSLITTMRAQLVTLLSAVDPSLWSISKITHSPHETLSLEAWLPLYAAHSAAHLNYIKRNLMLYKRYAAKVS